VGVVGADDVTLVASGATFDFEDKRVGNGKGITAAGTPPTIAGTDVGNYDLDPTLPALVASITRRPATITGVTAEGKIYDGDAETGFDVSGATVQGAVPYDDVGIGDGAAFASFEDKDADVGKTVVFMGFSLSGGDAANYALSGQPAATTASIAPKPLAIGEGDLVIDNKTYDGNTDATVASGSAGALEGVVSADGPEVALIGTPTFSFESKGAGTGIQIVYGGGLTLDGPAASNYTLDGADITGLTADIDPRPLGIVQGTFEIQDKVYDGGTQAASEGALALDDVVAPDDVTLVASGMTFAFPDKNVGDDKAITVGGTVPTISGTDAGNYDFDPSPPALTASITPQALSFVGTIYISRVQNTDVTDFNLVLENETDFSGPVSGEGFILKQGTVTEVVVPPEKDLVQAAAPIAEATLNGTLYALEAASGTSAANYSLAEIVTHIEILENLPYDGTLAYSEGAVKLGSPQVAGDAWTETTDTELAIDLASPVGTATVRHFTADKDARLAKWELTSSGTGGTPTLTEVTAKRTVSVSFPVGFKGTAALAIGDHTVTFNVVADRPRTLDLDKGDTFVADGIEWRILSGQGDRRLVIAEHVLESRTFHSSGSTYPTWQASDLRTWLNNDSSGFLSRLTTLAPLVQTTDIPTRDGNYEIGSDVWGTTQDKVFLLGIEEAWYAGADDAPVAGAATTGTAARRTSGDDVLFADDNARKAGVIGPLSYYYSLRSPPPSDPDAGALKDNFVSAVYSAQGTLSLMFVNTSDEYCGLRPALWLDATPLPSYTLAYSEGAVKLGSPTFAGDAWTETTGTTLAIDLTSPVQAATVRYFTASENVPFAEWKLTDTDGSHDATLTEVTAGRSYGVSFPVGFAGTATLEVGDHVVTFDVAPARPRSLDLDKGETFAADGYEWRVLSKRGGRLLVIAEHILENRHFHNGASLASTWRDSDLRAYLNGASSSDFLSKIPTLAPFVQETGLRTKANGYNGGSTDWTTTQDRVFLLGIEEAHYAGADDAPIEGAATTGTADRRTSGNDVLFADDNARKTNTISGSNNYWLRSPTYGSDSANSVSVLSRPTGGLFSSYFNSNPYGVRPALWLDMTLPAYTLAYSEGAVRLGSHPVAGDAWAETARTELVIDLASPIGAATVRHFTASQSVPAAEWKLASSGTGSAPARTEVVANSSYGVSIPAGFAGTATLTVGSYTVTFKVAGDRPRMADLDKGETFVADGIEWRALSKQSDAVLVIAEHALENRALHGSGAYPTWQASDLRAWLNDASGGFLSTVPTLAPLAKATDVTTRDGNYESGSSNRTTTTDKVFLLGTEELWYAGQDGAPVLNSATTGTAAQRTGGDDVLFADDNARKATSPSDGSDYYWSRSPSCYAASASYATSVNRVAGTIHDYSVTEARGVRPALWVRATLFDYGLAYSEGAVRLGPSASGGLEIDAWTPIPGEALGIDLASPVGVPTLRHFTSTQAVPRSDWKLSSSGTGGTPSLTEVTADRSYGVSFPVGFAGTATLKVGGTYTVTFDVAPNRPRSLALGKGDTFVSDGYEWRILSKQGSKLLIIAEHTVESRVLNNVALEGHGIYEYRTWDVSDLRAYLNDATSGFLSKIPTLASFAQTTGVPTRDGNYYDGSDTWRTTQDKVFLLGVEEAFYAGLNDAPVSYSATTGTTAQRVSGDEVVFADDNARKTRAADNSPNYWLRSPSEAPLLIEGQEFRAETCISLFCATGTLHYLFDMSNGPYGLRPVLWIDAPMPAYTLAYSEGAVRLGSPQVAGDAWTETMDTTLAIDLTSPVGAPTTRHFTASQAVGAARWTLDEASVSSGVTLTQVTAGLSYGVSIPVGFTGTVTLKAVDYTVTFNVAPADQSQASTRDKGETFAADGIEWRVLGKRDGKVLVTSEHVLEGRKFHSGGAYPTWEDSDLRAWLNSAESEGFLGTIPTLASLAVETDVPTRDGAYDGGSGSWTSTRDRIFLLGVEEASYAGADGAPALGSATTGTAEVRTSGDEVLFADANARKAGALGASSYYWLRSPSYAWNQDAASAVAGGTGALANVGVTGSQGLRPALWIDTALLGYTLAYSEGALMLGSHPVAGDAWTETTDTNLTIDMTSPTGAPTTRHFTTSAPCSWWDITTEGTGGPAALTAITQYRSYSVSIPEGFVGTVTLQVGAKWNSPSFYTVTFNVEAARPHTLALDKGDTFAADGIEWRVLSKAGNRLLVLSEHTLGTHSNVDGNIWKDSVPRTYLNATFLSTLPTLQPFALETHIPTRDGAYGSGSAQWTSTTDKVFLLGLEEAFYAGEDNAPVAGSATTGTAEVRTSGGDVLFIDDNARKVKHITDLTMNSWLLRSPAHSGSSYGASKVVSATGAIDTNTTTLLNDLRPALWLDLTPLPSYTLSYSEGILKLGSLLAEGDAWEETVETTLAIDLASPVGAPTLRHFTAGKDVPEGDWKLTDTDPAHDATLTEVTADRSYAVSVPAGFAGTATLKVGGSYSVTFDVAPARPQSAALDKGETFLSDGIEWRVLSKQEGRLLVIAEHVLESRALHSTAPYPTWEDSSLRAYLGTASSAGFLGRVPVLASLAKETDVPTRDGAYDGGSGSWTTTQDRLFLLGAEEVFYTGQDDAPLDGSATTGTAEVRTGGDDVLFIDDNARKAGAVDGGAATDWQLRSPAYDADEDDASTVAGATGTPAQAAADAARGLRPALWLDTTLPAYALSYSEGAVKLGSHPVAGDAWAETLSTSLAIDLASPVGAPTLRHFTAGLDLPQGDWKLTSSGTGAVPSLTEVTANRSYAVSFPAGFAGTATLTAGSYTVAFDVEAARPQTLAPDKGDTFVADDIEWRVLSRQEGRLLVIAEHMLRDMQFHGDPGYSTWRISGIRQYFRDAPGGFRDRLPTLASLAIETDVRTKDAAYGSANSDWRSTSDRYFFLGLEEAFYAGEDNASVAGSATTGTAAQRTSGDDVLFADDNARRAGAVGGATAQNWWLRSPAAGTDGTSVSAPAGATGAFAEAVANTGQGLRPALWLDTSLPSYALSYSEGAVKLGSYPVATDAWTETLSTSLAIDLTSPTGAPTLRHFTAGLDVPQGDWKLTDTDPAHDATLTEVTANRSFGVSFPAGFEGTATLKVGSTYRVTFDVEAARPQSPALKKGETFLSDGIEWRVLSKKDSLLLVTSEHVLENRALHSASAYPTWEASDLRAYLNTASSTGFLGTVLTLASLAKETDVTTRDGNYKSGSANRTTTTDKVFLLGTEELWYAGRDSATVHESATTGTAAQRTSGDDVLFADDNARKANTLSTSPAGGSDYYWSRSPSCYDLSASYATSVDRGAGTINDYGVTDVRGVRPALWLDTSLPAYALSYSEGAVKLGSHPVAGDAWTETAATDLAIGLTSPVGVPTLRHFTSGLDVAAAEWKLESSGTGGTPALTEAAAGRSYSVTFPVGFAGTATLTVGSYTVSFDVAPARPHTVALGKGDTFAADGIEWRFIDKKGSRLLVTSEHVLEGRQFHGSYATWRDSDLRAWLSDASSGGFLGTVPTLAPLAQEAGVQTQSDVYGTGGAFEATIDKVFLLGTEEAFYAGEDGVSVSGSTTTGTAGVRIGGSDVLFADAYARKAGSLGAQTDYWLRSPSYAGNQDAALVEGGTGGLSGANVTGSQGLRPALWLDTALPAYTLSYSEGAARLGSHPVAGDAWEETAATELAIDLTSPTGAPTLRHFTSGLDVPAAEWKLESSGTGGTPSLTEVTADRSYAVSIPAGFAGTATLAVGSYTVSFDVAPARPQALALGKGETFLADGIEWRVLGKREGSLLVTSEHVLEARPFHNGVEFDYPTWGASTLRSWINDPGDDLLSTLTTLAPLAQETGVPTRDGAYAGGSSSWTTTQDKVFLLGIEEALYAGQDDAALDGAATTGTAAQRIGGNDVLFADALARKAGPVGAAQDYWLRSPSYAASQGAASVVTGATGGLADVDVIGLSGLRPVLWIQAALPAYTLDYSEGALRLGTAQENPIDAWTETVATSLAIDLTSPVGAPTLRHFTASQALSQGDWKLTDTDPAHDAALTEVVAGRSYAVSIPVGFAGTATLKVGSTYSVTFSVASARPHSLDLKKGETFSADGIEWRVLSGQGSKLLVIAEHPLEDDRAFNGTAPYPTWGASDLRAWLNSTAGGGFLSTLPLVASLAQDTGLQTKDDRYDEGVLGLGSTRDKVFLLGIEEAFYAGRDNVSAGSGMATTGTADRRTNGSDVLFADDNARKANTLGAAQGWWLRSPSDGTQADDASGVTGATGTIEHSSVTVAHGVRPALWMDATPLPSYSLAYSEGALRLGSVAAAGDAWEETVATDLAIDLASPVGAPTLRHFTTSKDVPQARWKLTSSGTGDKPTLTQAAADRSYGVFVPEGFEGTATLIVDGIYTVTFDVTAARPRSSDLAKGETFVADGIEWRVLSGQEGRFLVIVEHPLEADRAFSGSRPYPTWSASDLRAWLNDPEDGFLSTLTTLAPRVQQTDVPTRDGVYGSSSSASSSWTTTADAVFLLGVEEAFFAGRDNAPVSGSATTGTAAQRISGNDVLFADALARKAHTPGPSEFWWLRSPSHTTFANSASGITSATGAIDHNNVTGTLGVRPALWIDQTTVTPSFTLDYSEGAVRLGAPLVANNAWTETVGTRLSIDLATPPSTRPTLRHFTASEDVPQDEWVLTDTDPTYVATLTTVVADRSFCVSIPRGFVGTATLKVGDAYTVTFNVAPARPHSLDLKKGDTFFADGYDWRVLAKKGSRLLIVDEHIASARRFHGGSGTWGESELRAWLNGGFLSSLTTLSPLAVETDIQTKGDRYDGVLDFVATTDKVFLLGIEEAWYAGTDNVPIAGLATTGTSEVRTSGNDVLFADDNARKATSEAGSSFGLWWLRSPDYAQGSAPLVPRQSLVDALTGTPGLDAVNNSQRGVRPALWIDMAPPLPFALTYSEGAMKLGANPVAGDAWTETTDTDLTVNLTAPIGKPTVRSFDAVGGTASYALLGSSGPTLLGGGRVSIPVGYTGVFRVEARDKGAAVHTLTFNVMADRPPSLSLNKGDTFAADGIEWRVLGTRDGRLLVTSEHVLQNRPYGSTVTYPTWEESGVRAWLNNEGSGFLGSLAALGPSVAETDIQTRSAAYGYAGSFVTTRDKVFLLGIEEAWYAGKDNASVLGSATTGNPLLRTSVRDVLFADDKARMASALSAVTATSWQLRSPDYGTNAHNASVVSCVAGTVGTASAVSSQGLRPTLWVDMQAFDVQSSSYALLYSEGAARLGSQEVAGDAWTETAGTDLTVTLASPVGAATVRHFAVSKAVPEGDWRLADTSVLSSPTLTRLDADLSYSVSFPVGFEGTATLTVGDEYVVTFDVAPARPPSSSLAKGDTFAADGIEWRVLGTQDGRLLVIAEHVLEARAFNLAGFSRWGTSDIRAWLNDESSGFLSTVPTLAPLAQETDVPTRDREYIKSPDEWTTTQDKVFLLGIEEVYYTGSDNAPVAEAATTGTAAQRFSGNDVLFADRNARRADVVNPLNKHSFWLRSPSHTSWEGRIALLVSDTGYPGVEYAYEKVGLRPVMWLDLAPLPAYALDYSEGAVRLGAEEVAGDAWAETAGTQLAIDLASPVGAPTLRHFTASEDVAAAEWELESSGTGGAPSLTEVTVDRSYAVSIPVGFEGTATLKVGAHTVTFDVAAARPLSPDLAKGETFAADGIEWRVLSSQKGRLLVIAEHLLADRRFRTDDVGTYPTWRGSDLHAWLNSAADGGFLSTIPTLAPLAQATSVLTRGASYEDASAQWAAAADKVFLLGIEEAYFAGTDNAPVLGSATTGTAVRRTSGNDVLFADDNARTASSLGIDSYYWLRSPSYGSGSGLASAVDGTAGGLVTSNVLVGQGVRPALWIDLAATGSAYTLAYSEGAVRLGSAAVADDAWTETIDTDLVIDLASPVGAPTTRHFTASEAVSRADWWLTDTDPTYSATLKEVTADRSYGVSFPVGFVGTATLKVGSYTVTLNVVPERPCSLDLGKGDTFVADGYEWRVLSTLDNRFLIIAEHMLFRNMGGYAAHRIWSSSPARTWLNGTVLDTLATLAPAVLQTTIQTNGDRYDGGSKDFFTTTDKLFLLGIEEAYYAGVDNAPLAGAATTGTADLRTNGTDVLFADDNARKTDRQKPQSDSQVSWVLRSPPFDAHDSANWISAVSCAAGALVPMQVGEDLYGGLRPALWIDMDVITPPEPPPSVDLPAYKLSYSEGATKLGSHPVEGDAWAERVETELAINLTSPIGASTVRHFTASQDVPAAEWKLESSGTGGTPALTTVTADRSFGVSIPAGFAGQVTLKVGGTYSVTFSVVTDRPWAPALAKGDAFAADGIEWRVLSKQGANLLVIAEHTLELRELHSDPPYPNWGSTTMRTYLNDAGTDGFLSRIPTLASMAQATGIQTKQGAYTTKDAIFESTTDTVFLLSVEEAFYAGLDDVTVSGLATTGTAEVRTGGNDVLFADANARTTYRANVPESESSHAWWLRSPSTEGYAGSGVSNNAAEVNCNNYTAKGSLGYYGVGNARGMRPALWIDASLPGYTLSYSEGAMRLGTYQTVAGDAWTESAATGLTVSLTSPRGAPTVRYFTASQDVPAAEWKLENNGWDGTPALTTVTPNRSYGVSIPAGFRGSLTLRVGSAYAVTFDVAGNRYYGPSLAKGDTFVTDGIEWRVLSKQGTTLLIIAEHMLEQRALHSGNYPTWESTAMRAYLNNEGTGGFLNSIPELASMAQATSIQTMDRTYTATDASFVATTDKVFLLSVEEAFYAGTDSAPVSSSATTGTAEVRTNGTDVIFADGLARMANTLANVPEGEHPHAWWLRSPSATSNVYTHAAEVNCTTYSAKGSLGQYGMDAAHGMRPALWVDLAGAPNLGTQSLGAHSAHSAHSAPVPSPAPQPALDSAPDAPAPAEPESAPALDSAEPEAAPEPALDSAEPEAAPEPALDFAPAEPTSDTSPSDDTPAPEDAASTPPPEDAPPPEAEPPPAHDQPS
jgi:hypothetical protein